MRRYALITVATAAAVIGGGVAVGSAQQNNEAQTPSPIPASAIKDSLQTKCDQSGEQIRREYPNAYVGDCNSGEGAVRNP
jgi:hypothetical protein